MGKYDRQIEHYSKQIRLNEETIRDHHSAKGPKWLGRSGTAFIARLQTLNKHLRGVRGWFKRNND